FQSYAVWPHMTVFDNIAFPLLNGRGRLPRAQVRERVRHALELVQLSGLEDRPAPMLSGGQQQRVALARALAVEPQVLLMDEPLSNLDARLREEVRDEIKALSKKLGVTVFYVTHDQVEAMALADTVAVMSHGKILQTGPAQAVYDRPADRSVGEFLGSMNELKGRVDTEDTVVTDVGPLVCGSLPPGLDPRGEVLVGVRPTDVYVSVAPTGRENEFPARVDGRVFLGDVVAYQLSVNGSAVACKTTVSEPALEAGMNVHVRFPKDKLKVFVIGS
ncbi:MAG: ABC transporter ATP-binding protein, partial [Deltaproteobacteria bacterium]|nr:ABC transporter ATP-binding protein [Deltaproteobacteria bacterium]